MNPTLHRSPVTLLFNPFIYVAGGKALLLGLAAILLASLLGSLSYTHFDGVLDTHTGAQVPLWFFISEGLLDWLCLTAVLLLAGAIVSRTSFRIRDVMGTQALARWPMLWVSLITLPPGFRRFGAYLNELFLKPGTKPALNMPDAVLFAVAVLMMIPLVCWMIYLMYRAYCVSCNVKEGRAVGTFIPGLILAEILSKVALYGMLKLV